jgi:hypothetical protein
MLFGLLQKQKVLKLLINIGFEVSLIGLLGFFGLVFLLAFFLVAFAETNKVIAVDYLEVFA